ncbi:Uncharacterised protein [Mycobacteroides abscessus subsp. abscessus]|nr:Uncharacterised protein [Mycobacteroides abscessus subsp. abscessus]
MCTETHAVGVADADSARCDVIDHPGELVDAQYGHVSARAKASSNLLESLHRARPEVGPDDVRQQAEDALEIRLVRLDESMRQQVKAQVDVVGVRRGDRQISDGGANRDDLDAACLVEADQIVQVGGNVVALEYLGVGQIRRCEFGVRVPDVEDNAGIGGPPVGHGCDACCESAIRRHGQEFTGDLRTGWARSPASTGISAGDTCGRTRRGRARCSPGRTRCDTSGGSAR